MSHTCFFAQEDHERVVVAQDNQAKGWLGVLLGVRLWYGFYGF